MTPSLRTVARGFAALFSSVVLLGPLAFGALVGAPTVVFGLFEIESPSLLTRGWIFASAWAALWLSVEAAMVQLYGMESLDRGGPRLRAVRYLLIVVTAVAGLVVAVRFLAMTIPWAIVTGDVTTQVLGTAVVVALAAGCTAPSRRPGEATRARAESGEADRNRPQAVASPRRNAFTSSVTRSGATAGPT